MIEYYYLLLITILSLDLWAFLLLLLLLILFWLYLKNAIAFFCCSLLCPLNKSSVFCLFRRREYFEKEKKKQNRAILEIYKYDYFPFSALLAHLICYLYCVFSLALSISLQLIIYAEQISLLVNLWFQYCKLLSRALCMQVSCWYELALFLP